MAISDKIRISMERSSWIRKMFEEGQERKAKFGTENVFDFSLGNPDMEPPPRFKQVLVELARDKSRGRHAYMPNAGFAETRQAVADYLNTFNRNTFSADEIVMTVGAAGGLNVVLKTLLDPGDEVIIPKPYFVEYDFYVDNHLGTVKTVPTKEDFSLDFDSLENAVSPKTKAVLINSPNNPTGKVYSSRELTELARLLSHYSTKQGRPIYLVSDEPYRKITYDRITVPNIFDLYPESFVVTSFSKDLSVPGERIGYIAASPELSDKAVVVAGMVFSNRILGYVNAPAFMQRAVSVLLEESVDIRSYQEKRNRLCEALLSFGYEFNRPDGAFYLFPRSPVEDEFVFVQALQEENILTVPGSGFGAPGHFRIAYCVPDTVIDGALPGFEKVIRTF
ncbi:MAG: pyridoxal phosphate-dependent aminotransferase [Deltaproteobacteria bacterium]|nr:MAG: pyridoxal phosphate-dependent aminotransferase [Deltaproteobacteria bacterium]